MAIYDFSAVAPTGQTLYYAINGQTVEVTYPGNSSSNAWSGFSKPTGALIIPDSVAYNSATYRITAIGNHAFYQCYDLTSISIPTTVISIGDYSFNSCRGLSGRLVLPNSVTTIGNSAFRSCINISDALIIPDSVTSIGDYAFSGCNGLTSISLGNNVASIGNYAFEACSLVGESLIIPNSVTSIGNNAFYYCNQLLSIFLGNSVASIGSYAFSGCPIKCLSSSATTPPTLGSSAFSNTTTTLYIPCATASSYRSTWGWNRFTDAHEYNTVFLQTCASGHELLFGVNCNDTTSVTLIYYKDDYWGTIIIPDTVTHNGLSYAVTQIGYHAFYNCRNLSSVTIPCTITNIGDDAFYGCTSITHITSLCATPPTISSRVFNAMITKPFFIPCGSLSAYRDSTGWSSLRKLQEYNNVFSHQCNSGQQLLYGVNCNTSSASLISHLDSCTGLLTIPDTVTHNGVAYPVTNICTEAFNNCNLLTSVYIPNTVTSIDNYAFYGCSNLALVTLDNTVPPTLGNRVLPNPSLLPIIVPCGAEAAYRANNSWRSYSNLREHANTFCQICSSGQELLYGINCNMNSVTLIKHNDSCSGTLVIPDSVTHNGTQYRVTHIATGAFYNCRDITSATLPQTITFIGDSAFYGCDNLNTVTMQGAAPPTIGLGVNADPSRLLLFVPCGSATAYRADSIWNTYNNITEQFSVFSHHCSSGQDLRYMINCDTISVTVTGYNNSCTDTLTIPDTVTHNGRTYNVTHIGPNAFYNCSNLTSLSIPSSVTTIDAYAFCGCSGIAEPLSLPSTTTAIGDYAFWNCRGISYVMSPATVPPTLGINVFYDSTIPIRIPCGAETAYRSTSGWSSYSNLIPGHNASFRQRCSSGQELTYAINCNATSVTVTGYNDSCTGSLTIPSIVTYNGTQYNVTHIGVRAFYNCSGLTSVTLPNSITVIEDYAFGSCSNITNRINLPDSLSSISNGAFYYCSRISGAINIPNSTTYVGKKAFYHCDNISIVIFPDSSIYVGDSAFFNCSNLSYIMSTATTPATLGHNVFEYYATPIYVPCGSVATYRAANNWSQYRWYIKGFLAITNQTCSLGQSLTYCIKCDSATATVIGHGDSCTGNLIIPDNIIYNGLRYDVTSIGYGAFRACTGIERVTIPNSVDTIWQHAFSKCRSIRSIIIGNSVEFISSMAFYYCDSLRSITSLNTTPPVLNGTPFSASSYTPVYVPCNSVSAYRRASGWQRFNNIQASAGLDTTATTCGSFTWNNHGNSNTYNTSGTYYSTYTTTGCTATDTLHLTIYNDSSTSFTVTDTNSYTWNNHGNNNTYTNSGTYYSSYLTADGCASTDTLYLTIISVQVPTVVVVALPSSSTMGSVSGGGTYNINSSVTLTASANTGYHFVNWSTGSTANPLTFTATCDTTITAFFETDSVLINVHPNYGQMGTVSGGGTYQVGSTVTLTATPNNGYHFVNWSTGSQANPLTFTATCDTTITAFFEADSVLINVHPNYERMGTVSGGGYYQVGSTATITATPNNGYHFVNWSTGDTNNPLSFTVSQAATYVAIFAEETQNIDCYESENLRIWSDRLTIYVANLNGEPVRVYDITGRLVAKTPNIKGNITIQLTAPGVYIVKTLKETSKLIAR